jgi:OOP family OmpA-OmpF porin
MAYEYRDFSNTLQHYFFGHDEALHFAEKGLASADGVVVMPEMPNDWNLSDRDTVEMTLARISLIEALDNGGRDDAPAEAAIAQSRFDCWAAEQGKNWNADIVCKRQFKNALRLLKAAIATTPTPSPASPSSSSSSSSAASLAEAAAKAAGGGSAGAAAGGADGQFLPPITGGAGKDGAAAKGDLASVQQAMFLVFFDWDKSSLSSDANGVLDAIATELKTRKDVAKVLVGGYADTSGGEEYNKNLSIARANTVRDALAGRGFPADKIATEGHGEQDLLVKTADNVREPANRRAQITLQ